jgi:hypothetical protein
MNKDDDTIKALGYVALYAAYVEESVEIVLERLSLFEAPKGKYKFWPISKKIDWCIETLRQIDNSELTRLINLLKAAKIYMDKRNEVIHGRIYSKNKRSDFIESGRECIPRREITALELYDLAEKLSHIQAAIPYLNSFATIRALNDKVSQKQD